MSDLTHIKWGFPAFGEKRGFSKVKGVLHFKKQVTHIVGVLGDGPVSF
jgi:hypothetical protein